MDSLRAATVNEKHSVSQVVAKTIATAKGTDPTELTPPLYEAVDPDALDQLFAPTPDNSQMNGEVIFIYNDYKVTISSDCYVLINQQDG